MKYTKQKLGNKSNIGFLAFVSNIKVLNPKSIPKNAESWNMILRWYLKVIIHIKINKLEKEAFIQ